MVRVVAVTVAVIGRHGNGGGGGGGARGFGGGGSQRRRVFADVAAHRLDVVVVAGLVLRLERVRRRELVVRFVLGRAGRRRGRRQRLTAVRTRLGRAHHVLRIHFRVGEGERRFGPQRAECVEACAPLDAADTFAADGGQRLSGRREQRLRRHQAVGQQRRLVAQQRTGRQERHLLLESVLLTGAGTSPHAVVPQFADLALDAAGGRGGAAAATAAAIWRRRRRLHFHRRFAEDFVKEPLALRVTAVEEAGHVHAEQIAQTQIQVLVHLLVDVGVAQRADGRCRQRRHVERRPQIVRRQQVRRGRAERCRGDHVDGF